MAQRKIRVRGVYRSGSHLPIWEVMQQAGIWRKAGLDLVSFEYCAMPPDAASVRVSQMQTPNPAHFHHVHLNATDPQKTFEFYEQVFGSKRVKFRDKSDALFTGRGFLLVSKVDRAPKDLETTSIRHIGWAGVDGPNALAEP